MNGEDTVLLYPLIGLMVLLPLGILKYALREKYASSIKHNPEARKSLLRYRGRLVQWSRIFLWLSPLWLILFPFLLSEFAGLNWVITFACVVMMVANLFVEYHFQKWFYLHLTKTDSDLNHP